MAYHGKVSARLLSTLTFFQIFIPLVGQLFNCQKLDNVHMPLRLGSNHKKIVIYQSIIHWTNTHLL